MLLGQRSIAGVPEDVEALRIGLHQPVFDAVVDHLHEMAGAARPGMDVALPGPRIAALPGRRRRNVARAGHERAEYRIEPLHHGFLAADHQAVAALQPPHAAARADIEIMDAALPQRLGARDVVLPERITAIDDRS